MVSASKLGDGPVNPTAGDRGVSGDDDVLLKRVEELSQRLSQLKIEIVEPQLLPTEVSVIHYLDFPITNWFHDLLHQSLHMFKVQDPEDDDVAESETIHSGVNFRWLLTYVPLLWVRTKNAIYKIVLAYREGFNRTVDPLSPYVFDEFRLVLKQIEEED